MGGENPCGGSLFIEGTVLGDDDRGSPGGGDVGHRVLARMGDHDIAAAQGRPRILHPAGPRPPEHLPPIAAVGTGAVLHVLDGHGGSPGAAQHEYPRASRARPRREVAAVESGDAADERRLVREFP